MISHDVPRQRESPTDNSPGGLRQGEKRHLCRNREWSGDGQRKGWKAADMALFTGSFENKLDIDRTSTRLNSSHECASRMTSSACIKTLISHQNQLIVFMLQSY